jgi:transposase
LKRRSKVIAVLDQIEAEELRQRVEQIPDHISLQELAEQVVRRKVKLTPAQQRMLIELFPFYMPELSVVGRCWILDQ